ncbi:pyridoxal-phosphate dependent enzyme [Streptomyces thermocarboxydus]
MPRTIADGQAVATPGELTFAVNRRLLDGVVLVDDEAIKEAMRFAFTRLKIVLEPSGATPLAALLTGRAGPLPPRVGLILSGGNVDTERFARLCAPGDRAGAPPGWRPRVDGRTMRGRARPSPYRAVHRKEQGQCSR